jgi:hypothetical protein
MQVYINGTLQGTVTDSYSTFTSNTYPMLIGAWSESNSEYAKFFKGKIDELMVYNRVLTPDEISSLYLQ